LSKTPKNQNLSKASKATTKNRPAQKPQKQTQKQTAKTDPQKQTEVCAFAKSQTQTEKTAKTDRKNRPRYAH
jgi:hypothetical protein